MEKFASMEQKDLSKAISYLSLIHLVRQVDH